VATHVLDNGSDPGIPDEHGPECEELDHFNSAVAKLPGAPATEGYVPTSNHPCAKTTSLHDECAAAFTFSSKFAQALLSSGPYRVAPMPPLNRPKIAMAISIVLTCYIVRPILSFCCRSLHCPVDFFQTCSSVDPPNRSMSAIAEFERKSKTIAFLRARSAVFFFLHPRL